MAYDGDVAKFERQLETPAVRVLRGTRARLERGWCQGGSGLRDVDGYPVHSDRLAASFCLAQALNTEVTNEVRRQRGLIDETWLANPRKRMDLDNEVWGYVTQGRSREEVVRFNDAPSTTLGDVLQLVDVALFRALEVKVGV